MYYAAINQQFKKEQFKKQFCEKQECSRSNVINCRLMSDAGAIHKISDHDIFG